MAAQLGAASSLPRASGRKRSWNADPPAFAKVVRVEPVAAPVRFEVYSIALRRSDARTENARAVQQLFAAHSSWGPLQVASIWSMPSTEKFSLWEIVPKP